MKQECCNINEVIQEFYDYLKAYIFNKTKDKSIAEDIVQNVMIKLVESHHKDTEITNVKAWLFQVSRNSIADYYKALNVPSELNSDVNKLKSEASKFDSLTSELNSNVSKFNVLPELVTSDYIVPMIRLLPDKYAIPLERSDIEKIPQQTIADQLNLSLSATKMRIQRGRIKLRALFAECCHLEYDKHGTLIGCTIKSDCKPLHEIEKDLKRKIK